MRIAMIRAQRVENIIEATQEFANNLPGYDAAVPSDVAGIGWTYIGGVFAAPAVPAHVTNKASIEQQAEAALTANTAYLGIADSATNAQVRTQVKALTQQVNKLIRLATGRLEATD